MSGNANEDLDDVSGEEPDAYLVTLWECPKCSWQNQEEGHASFETVTCGKCETVFTLGNVK